MKRYEMYFDPWPHMREDKDGGYIRFTDHHASLDEVLKEAVWAMELLERTYCQLEHTQELTLGNNTEAYLRAVKFRRDHPLVADWRARQEENQ